VSLGPIALYMTKDLYAAADGEWQFAYPPLDQAMALGEGRIYNDAANDLVIFTYGNGVPMSLRAARDIERAQKWNVRVVDLRWLVPLNGSQAYQTFRLRSGGTKIGTAPPCDIVVNDGFMSTEHAQVNASPQGFCLVDVKMWMSGGSASGSSSVPTRTKATTAPAPG